MKCIKTLFSVTLFCSALLAGNPAHASMKTCWHVNDGVRETDPFAWVPSHVTCPKPPRHDCNGNVMPPPGGTQPCGDQSSSKTDNQSAGIFSFKPIVSYAKTCPECHHCTVHEQDGGLN